MIYRIDNRILKYVTILIFSVQLVMIHSITFGYTYNNKEKISTWVTVMDKDESQKNDVKKVLEVTCTPDSSSKISVVGVDFPYMNADSLSYYSMQEKLKADFSCYYTSLGFAETDSKKAMERLYKTIKPPYYIWIEAEKIIDKQNIFNAISLQALKNIEENEKFEELNVQNKKLRIFKNTMSE